MDHTVAHILICLSFGQQLTSSAVSLTLAGDLHWNAEAITILWMYQSVAVAVLSPALGAASDLLAARRVCSRAAQIASSGAVTLVLLLVLHDTMTPTMTDGAAVTFRRVVAVLSMLTAAQTMATSAVNGWVIAEARSIDATAHPPSVAQDLASIQARCMSFRSVGSVLGALVEALCLALLQRRAVQLLPTVGVLSYGATAGLALWKTVSRNRSSDAIEPSHDSAVDKGYDHCADSSASCPFSWPHWDQAQTLLRPLCFVALLSATPSASSAYFVHLVGTIKIPTWVVSVNGAVGLVGSLCGSLVSVWFTSQKRGDDQSRADNAVLLRCIVLGCFASFLGTASATLVVLGCDAQPSELVRYVLVVVQEFLASLCLRVGFLPVCVVASAFATKARLREAAVFELFATSSMLGGVLSGLWTVCMLRITGSPSASASGAIATAPLMQLVVVCALLKLLPLLCIRLAYRS